MSDEQSTNQYSFEELRKKYPRMGKRWDPEEDERLKQAYEEKRAQGLDGFDAFITRLVQEFGRAAGGLKARLAQHFADVPGWDYKGAEERDAWRKEQKTKEDEAAIEQFGEERTTELLAEYEKYVHAKRETFRKFVLRMSHRFEESRRTTTAVLESKIEKLIQYATEDIEVPVRRRAGDEELTHVDFSGNEEAQEALRIMDQTGEHLFLTGEAGTGKSTLLQYFRQTTRKNIVVLAPTGVAALSVQGQTIHSFCGFGPDITLQKVKKLGPWSPKKKLLSKLAMVVIDEISMVRADLLDCVDKFLRINGPVSSLPFGGLQMVFIGDLYQLPPVEKDFGAGDGLLKEYASPYFFDSKAFRGSEFQYIQLQTMYRQQDRVFIDVLNAVRNNAAQEEHLTVLNARALQEGQEKFSFEQFAIYLTPTNARARQVNNFFLERIHGPLLTYEGTASGTFEDRELPTDLNLQIKVGSQIMMLNNDQRKRWVNGTMGKVVGVAKNYNDDHNNDRDVVSPRDREGSEMRERPTTITTSDTESISYEFDDLDYPEPEDDESEPTSTADSIIVELETGDTVYVQPHTWEMFKFVLDSRTQGIDSQVTGTFRQYPFKLAWAVTIHKAQGKTFNKVYIDLATGTFAHGQLYVALSRCRTLEGLYLRRPVTTNDIILDPRVVGFIDSLGVS